MVRQGEIVEVDFRLPDDSTKKHPALVVSNVIHDAQGDFIYAILISSKNINPQYTIEITPDIMNDLAHAAFIDKLEYVASKYGVVVHKIDRWYASSKTCECGYVNKSLQLSDREWICPKCGNINHRDLLAANNILRKGISELWSGCKTECNSAIHACTQESHAI